MDLIEQAVVVIVVMSAQNDVYEVMTGVFSQLIVVGLTLVGEGNDQISTLGLEIRDEELSSLSGRAIFEIGRERIDGGKPFAFAKAYHTNFDAVGGR